MSNSPFCLYFSYFTLHHSASSSKNLILHKLSYMLPPNSIFWPISSLTLLKFLPLFVYFISRHLVSLPKYSAQTFVYSPSQPYFLHYTIIISPVPSFLLLWFGYFISRHSAALPKLLANSHVRFLPATFSLLYHYLFSFFLWFVSHHLASLHQSAKTLNLSLTLTYSSYPMFYVYQQYLYFSLWFLPKTLDYLQTYTDPQPCFLYYINSIYNNAKYLLYYHCFCVISLGVLPPWQWLLTDVQERLPTLPSALVLSVYVSFLQVLSLCIISFHCSHFHIPSVTHPHTQT